MDDLTAPLGLAPAKKPGRQPLRLVIAGGAAIAVAAIGVVAWALLIHDPRGAETVAVVPVAKEGAGAPVKDRTGTIRPSSDATEPLQSADEPGLVEITPAGNLTDLGNGVTITDPNAAPPMQLASAPLEGLLEDGPYGQLPRVGADGEKPMQAYARPIDANAPRGVRIAIVVGGVGIAENGTRAAIRDLPGEVTLAIAPYGKDVAKTVADARDAGHEILLQIPLEPFGYPRVDPGPKTLTLAAKNGENIDRLHWLMSRLTTYAGVVNYLGARFTADDDKMAPVLDEVGRRGLFYLDDGSSETSSTDKLAAGIVPFARADLVLDADTDAGQIDAQLKQLEALARERGYAIGSATAFPVTIERIAVFAKRAADHGIVLVPVSALVHSGKT